MSYLAADQMEHWAEGSAENQTWKRVAPCHLLGQRNLLVIYLRGHRRGQWVDDQTASQTERFVDERFTEH